MSSIDVVIPCYRYAHFLRECVRSVLTQSHGDIRVLILDDASPDNTPEVAGALAAEDPRVTYVRHAVNKGHIATYNEGIEWAAADYFLLLSADDVLLPGAFERAIRFLDTHPQAGFLFSDAMELAPDGSKHRSNPVPGLPATAADCILESHDFIVLCAQRNVVPTPTAIIRTSLQKRVGGYRPDLPHAGDMEMWLRLAVHGPVGYIHVPQAIYRLHSTNMSHAYNQRSRLPDLLQRKAALESFLGEYAGMLPRAGEIRRQAFRTYSRDAVGYASAAFNNGDCALSKQLADYAVTLSPDTRQSWQWLKYTMKIFMGPRIWRALNPYLGKPQALNTNTDA